jgi:UPF0042 nucleotide-binding protein
MGTPAAAPRYRVLVVSGMSGAGKSTALKVLEDLGYEAVDNLPLSLLRRLTSEPPMPADGSTRRALAVGIDTRTRDFRPESLLAKLGALRERQDLEARLVFMDCDDGVLQSRFTATRRRHPLAADRPVGDGIAIERRLMWPLRRHADDVIDTSQTTLPELRRQLTARFALGVEPGLNLQVLSFSYARGLPRDADLVFDVRFLENPHYSDKLRPLTGDAPEVAAFIAADPTFTPFFRGLGDLLVSLLPHYSREGKRYLTVAVGCTGGRHRSVFVAGKLAQLLADEGYRVALRHRDRDLVES